MELEPATQSTEVLDQGNEGTKPKGRKGGRLVCDLILDFAKNSTLHGLRYFTEGLTALEKIFWATIVLTSVVLCVYAISNTWFKWQTSPIIISVNDQLMSASEVPFPAVTICPQGKVDQMKFNYTMHWITFWKNYNRIHKEKITSEEKDKRMKKFMDDTRVMYELANVNLICNENQNRNGYFAKYARGDTLVQNIIKAAPEAKTIVFDNKWRNKYLHETDKAHIGPALTQEGLCFTFNSLATDEIFHMDRIQKNYSYLDTTAPQKGWSLEHGYSNSTGHDVYPRRGQASGYEADLFLRLRQFSYRRELLCDYHDEGYKVYFHHPADLPQTSLHHYIVQPMERVSLAVKINVVTTSDSLVKYPPHVRQCYFPTEKSLRYFRAYTPNNCRLECLTNHTLTRCGCVYLHMPRNDSALCVSLQQRSCFMKAISEYSATEDGFGNQCHCLPSCYSVQYEAEITKNYFDWAPSELAMNLASNEVYNRSKIRDRDDHIKDTFLKIYFKEARFATMKRSELYGPTDFLASCGGLLGLFLGFSFLSLVEFFYFFTLRLGCMFRKYKVPNKEKQTDDVNIQLPEVSKY